MWIGAQSPASIRFAAENGFNLLLGQGGGPETVAEGISMRWRVTVTVSDGVVKLEGEVDSQHQRGAAERVIRQLTGVKGVTNLLRVKATITPTDVKANIKAAFQRSAVIDAGRVEVETRDGKVFLRGSVRSWAERDTAEHAAWAAPGVTSVVNMITIEL